MKSRRAFGERLLALAMLCHPPSFRRHYRDEMLDYYRETCRRESRGPLWRARFLAASFGAAVREEGAGEVATGDEAPARGDDVRAVGRELALRTDRRVRQVPRRRGLVARPAGRDEQGDPERPDHAPDLTMHF